MMQSKIKYVYAQDQYYVEMKDAENARNRLDLLTQVAPFVGTFYSKKYVMKNFLRMKDEDIDKNLSEIQQEGPPPDLEQPNQ